MTSQRTIRGQIESQARKFNPQVVRGAKHVTPEQRRASELASSRKRHLQASITPRKRVA